MKKLLVILLCVSLYNIAFAQKNLEYGAHYSILSSVGIQFPFGDFAKADLDDGDYAQIGINMKLLDFGYTFFEDVGIKASYFYGSNSFDNNSFITDFVKSQQLAYNIELYSASYLYHAPMVGLQYKIDIDNFVLLLHGMAGPTYLMTPEFTLSTGPYSMEFKSQTGNSIGYCFGALLIKSQTNSKRNKHLTFSLNYIMSDIDLKGIIEYQDGSQTVVDDRAINFRNLSVMVGVVRPLK